MKLLLKLAFIAALIVLVWVFWPSLVVPLTIVALAGCIVGLALAGTLALFAGVGLAVLVGVLGAALLLVLGLSPVWLPILAIVGLVQLFRRPRTPTARVEAV